MSEYKFITITSLSTDCYNDKIHFSERFKQTKSATNSIPTDDIPVIPDMDDVKDEIMLNEIVEPPT